MSTESRDDRLGQLQRRARELKDTAGWLDYEKPEAVGETVRIVMDLAQLLGDTVRELRRDPAEPAAAEAVTG